MRRLNVKLVVWLSTTSLLLIVLVGVVHAWQMKRTAKVLLFQAQAAEEEGDLEKAASFYQQYVAYVPDNAEEGAHMALLMADIAELPGASNAKKRAAYDALEAQLRRHLERDDVRRRLVDYTMLMHRFGDAIEHIQTLLKTDPDDVDLLTKRGQCQYYLDRNREAAETFEQVLNKDPQTIIAYGTLARIFRDRLSDPERADQMIDKMVEANPEDAKARLTRAEYLREFFPPQKGNDVAKEVEQRHADLKKALELAPDDADVLLMSAIAAVQQSKPEEARRQLEHASKLHPDDERIIQQLIGLDAQDQNYESIADRLEHGPKSLRLQQIDFELKLAKPDLEAARKVLAVVEKDKDAPPAIVEYMRAMLSFKEGKWLQASRDFERLKPAFPDRASQIDMMLGHCYELLGEYDRELEAYERAVGDNATSVPAHVGLARALIITGQPDRALAELELVKRGVGIDEFVKNTLARNALLSLLMQRNSKLPEAEQNWDEVDQLAAAAAKAFGPGSKDLLLLESTIREQKGDRGAAREMLKAATEKDPTDQAAWLSLARLAFLDEGAAAALALLDDAKKKAGDSFGLRSAQIAYAAQLPKEQAKELLATLAVGLEKFKEDEPEQLRRALGIAYYRLDDWAQARAMWSKVAEKKADDPQVQFILFDIAVREGDDAKIAKNVDNIKRLFGDSSAEAKYAEARRKVVPVREKRSNDSKAALAEARQLVRRAAEQRPHWAVLARFEAEIDVLDGRLDDAIEHLRHAFELGDNDVGTAREIARLLVIRGRGEEAKPYTQLASSSKGSGTDGGVSEMLEVGIALTENDLPKAVKLLEQSRERTPDDPQKILTLGQLLPRLGREEEAEQLLRGLIDKQPDLPVAWLELIKLLAQQKRTDDAHQVIAEAQTKLPKEQVDLVVGQCFEALGELDTAEKHFIEARDSKPDDIGLTRALATFYLRTREAAQTKEQHAKYAAKAKEQLERLLHATATNEAQREHVAWGNRELAKIVAAAGTYGDFQDAMRRLRPAQGKTASLADKLAMAQLLYTRPEADSRQEAARLLEDIRSETALQPDGQVILAGLYEATGNWPKCRDEMLSVLGKIKDNPNYIATFISMLLRNNDLDAATFWLDKLEQLAPDSTATAVLRARVLVKQGKSEEAVAVLRNLLPRPMPREKLSALVTVAGLLEEIEQNDAAEAMYREYAALEPTAILLLAGFAGRHGSLKDALDLCQSALEVPTMTVDAVVREALNALRLHQADATREDYGRVEGWVTKAIARKPKELILRLDYAELLDLQSRYAELEEIYSGLLKNADVTGNQRAFVLNNLAYLLAAQGKKGESRKLIDEAVQIMGPTSDLRDTRALVYMTHGDSKQAIEDLNLSVVDQPSGIKYFHLARAYQLAKDSQGAQNAMHKAVDSFGLKASDLPRLEQNAFRQLSQSLGIEPAPEARSSAPVAR